MTEWEGLEVEGRLGVGSTGTVWLARQLSVGRRVAVKELAAELAGDETVRERLRQEARVLARLDHPNCVAVYSYLESGSRAAIVMEYVEGVSLRVLSQGPALSVEQALLVLEGALSGLAYAHSQNVLHGDVKPENILLATSGASKLVDFGLAAAVGSRRAAGVGSPGYTSPEAAAGEPLGVASDVHSAGLVLGELLRGTTTPGGGAAAMAADGGGLPGPVAALLGRAVDPDPAVRPSTATAFLAELRAAADEGCGTDWRRRAALVPLVAAALSGAAGAVGVAKAAAAAPADPDPTPARSRTRTRLTHTHPWAAAVTAAVILVAVGVGLGYGATKTFSSSPSTPPPARAALTSPTPTTEAGVRPILSASSVTQFVTTFYDQYLACLKTNNGSTCTTSLVKADGTPSLSTHYTPAPGYVYQADPILCAQNTPYGFQVADMTATPNTASGTVTEYFTTSTTTRFVVVERSGALKIDTITCSPPLAPARQPTGGNGPGTTVGSGAAAPPPTSESPTTLSTSGAAPCTVTAITAAARVIDGANLDAVDGFGCSGRFAYAFATVGSGSTKDDVTMLFMANNATWQPASRVLYCENGSVPAQIYQPACETQ